MPCHFEALVLLALCGLQGALAAVPAVSAGEQQASKQKVAQTALLHSSQTGTAEESTLTELQDWLQSTAAVYSGTEYTKQARPTV